MTTSTHMTPAEFQAAKVAGEHFERDCIGYDLDGVDYVYVTHPAFTSANGCQKFDLVVTYRRVLQ